MVVIACCVCLSLVLPSSLFPLCASSHHLVWDGVLRLLDVVFVCFLDVKLIVCVLCSWVPLRDVVRGFW